MPRLCPECGLTVAACNERALAEMYAKRTPKRVHVRDYGYENTGTYEYVGRRGSNGLGNPFLLSGYSRDEAVDRYEQWVLARPQLMAYIRSLRGRDIGCHCGPRQRCHGDVILRLANTPQPE